MRLVSKNAASARRVDAAAKSRREQLLDQAARELNSTGISMTSLTDVADKLGFSRASLYYSWAKRRNPAAARCRLSAISSPEPWILRSRNSRP